MLSIHSVTELTTETQESLGPAHGQHLDHQTMSSLVMVMICKPNHMACRYIYIILQSTGFNGQGLVSWRERPWGVWIPLSTSASALAHHGKPPLWSFFTSCTAPQHGDSLIFPESSQPAQACFVSSPGTRGSQGAKCWAHQIWSFFWISCQAPHRTALNIP